MRFDRARERKKHAVESIPAGRDYVEAYEDYIHFVESVHRLANEATSNKHRDAK